MTKPVLSLIASLFLMSSANADTVQFTNRELDAVFTLLRPELNQVVLSGRGGTFYPGPALRSFGLQNEKFEIDLTLLGKIADLRFDGATHLPAKVRFKDGAFEVELPLVDNTHLLRSRVGRMGGRGVSLTAVLKWRTVAGGRQELVIDRTIFRGTLFGTGILGTNFAIQAGKKIALKSIGNAIARILREDEVQDQIQAGLLGWAKFYLGETQSRITAGSVRFYNTVDVSGLEFETEK